MPRLLGRNEVERQRQRFDAVLASVDGAGLSPELIAHFARYGVVLLSGFVEQSVKELASHHARTKADPRTHRYVTAQIKRFMNVDDEKLKQLVESFDPQWWADLSSRFEDELSAFQSVSALRNNISHGLDAGITLATLKQYRDQVVAVIGALCDLFDPP